LFILKFNVNHIVAHLDYNVNSFFENIVQMGHIWRIVQMFTELFGELLQKRQLTAYRIAKDLNISQGLMRAYKVGIKRPTIDNLVKIADYFDVSTDYLLGRTNNPDINK